jgi:membrane protease YdiL (CAAX protease family)
MSKARRKLSTVQRTKNLLTYAAKSVGLAPKTPATTTKNSTRDSVKNYVKKPSKNLDEAIKKARKSGRFDNGGTMAGQASGDGKNAAARSAKSGKAVKSTKSKKLSKEITAKSPLAAKIKNVVGWLLWVTAAFFLANVVVALPLAVLQSQGLFDMARLGVIGSTLLQASIYAVMMVIACGGAAWYHRRRHGGARRFKLWPTIGFGRRPAWRDVGYALFCVPVYFALSWIAQLVMSLLLDPTVLNQTQTIGFSTTGNSAGQLLVIFVALVIVPPVAEEIMMRGLLFGRLRRVLAFWPAAILVSLLFAVAHWQINIGIDTFVLSLVLCYIREETGAIWGTILLHMLKNGVAFALLFTL